MRVVEAFVLVQTHVGMGLQVLKRIAGLDGVTRADLVTGPFDLILRADATSIDELGKLVLRPIQAVDGVTRTMTCPILHRDAAS